MTQGPDDTPAMPPTTINFFKGHPTNSLLPTEAVLRATQSLLTRVRPEDDCDDDRHPLTYGSDPGARCVRARLAEWSATAFKETAYAQHHLVENAGFEAAGEPVDPDSINLTNGASYGAMNALLQLTLPHRGGGAPTAHNVTRRAFIVSPTYFLINSVFLDAGFAGKLTAVRQDAHTGDLDFDFLEQQLEHYSQEPQPAANTESEGTVVEDASRPAPRKVFQFVIYLVPTFSNPTGCTLSLAGRLRLLALARKYDMLILCDDVYDLLDFDKEGTARDPLPPRIVTLDRWTLPPCQQPAAQALGNTISNLTFSKLLGPGLRVGWQETPTPALAQQHLAAGGAVRSGGTPAHFATMVVGELLALGLADRTVAQLCTVYAARAAALRAAAARHLPAGARVYGAAGGYFAWLELPLTREYEAAGLTAARVAAECRARAGVVLAPGGEFEVTGQSLGWGRNCFRLSVSYLTEAEIEEGVQRVGRVLSELLAGN